LSFTDEQLQAIEDYEEEKRLSIWLNKVLEYLKEKYGEQ